MPIRTDFAPLDRQGQRSGRLRSFLLETVLVMAVFCLQSIFFSFLALRRLIAPDEGFYLFAARLITEGYAPYIDFFYPQMPYLPYLYGLWNLFFANDWSWSRLLSALFTSASGALLFFVCLKKMGLLAGVASTVLFCSSNFVFPWYLTAQTYASSVFFLLCAYTLVLTGNNFEEKSGRSKSALFSSGFFLGLASGVRLFFAGLFPLFILYLLFASKDLKERVKDSAWLLLGFTVALLPALVLASLDWKSFHFNNLGYHFIRSEETFQDGLAAKVRMAKVLFGFIEARQFAGFSIVILLYLSLLQALVRLQRQKLPDLAFLIAAALFVINFLPTPSYHQYFSTLVPFLIISSLLFLDWLASFMFRFKTTGRLLFVTIAVFLFWQYIKHFPSDYRNFTKTGHGVTGIGVSRPAHFWNIETISKVSQAIDRHSQKGDKVVAIWPGYLFTTRASILPGLENHFGRRVAPLLSSSSVQHYNLVTDDQVAQSIREHIPRLIVINVRRGEEYLLNVASQAGYISLERLGGVEIFGRPKGITLSDENS